MNTQRLFLVVASILLSVAPAGAVEWHVWKNCNNGALIIDYGKVDNGRGSNLSVFQVVIHNQGVIDYFKSKGATYFFNEGPQGREMIFGNLSLPSSPNFSDSTPPERWGDTRRWATVTVKEQGAGVKVSLYWLVSLGDEMRKDPIADWTFEECHGGGAI